jgi:hypothetical protein
MTDKIIPFTGDTRGDINPDDMFDNNKSIYECAIVIGYTKEGSERLVSSTGDSALMIWLLERAKKIILESADFNDEWEH